MATAVAGVALSAGCTSAGGPSTSDPGASQAAPQPDVPVVDSEACDKVRTGIEAFNLGDYDGTVEHFEAAVPFAEEQDDGSTKAGQLVEAVRYYAALDAEAYPEAARSSPEFARYKAITLGQCMPVDREVPEESPGTDV